VDTALRSEPLVKCCVIDIRGNEKGSTISHNAVDASGMETEKANAMFIGAIDQAGAGILASATVGART